MFTFAYIFAYTYQLREVDLFMSNYDIEKEIEAQNERGRKDQVDEDGFTLVTALV